MDAHQKVLFVNAGTGFYRVARYPLGSFFGHVDLGLYLAGQHNSLNIGTGLLAGSIFPGSNRLIFTSFSPCWGGFFISSMGGAGLVFDNLGVNRVSLVGRAPTPSLLSLKRHREVEGNTDGELLQWIERFEQDKAEAALAFWYEVHKGIHESLREF
jgi:glyceraldehyde-3-phosphate dehydrogenase (ferredoxin)